MFSTKWQTSQRKYDVGVDRDVEIPVGAGMLLDADVYRPNAQGRFPRSCARTPIPRKTRSRR